LDDTTRRLIVLPEDGPESVLLEVEGARRSLDIQMFLNIVEFSATVLNYSSATSKESLICRVPRLRISSTIKPRMAKNEKTEPASLQYTCA
jgi:hypothetical protein